MATPVFGMKARYYGKRKTAEQRKQSVAYVAENLGLGQLLSVANVSYMEAQLDLIGLY